LNKPVYEGVCSRAKRYSVLLGTSSDFAGDLKVSQQNLYKYQRGDVSDATHTLKPLAKPSRTLNTVYKGASRRRYSGIVGESTNARSKANKGIASMGRPANRWTADGPLKAKSKLPRLPPAEPEAIEEKKGRILGFRFRFGAKSSKKKKARMPKPAPIYAG
jgi:hypothetical protein